MVFGTDKQFNLGSRATSRVTPSNPFIKFSRNDIEQSIGSRFQQIVGRDPSRIAIKLENRVVTYAILNGMANRVAYALRSASGTGNEPVAVFGGNDVETIAAILGVFKAGKIYVPLDSSFSEAWAKFILQDTETKIVLTGRRGLGLVKSWLSDADVLIDFESLDPGWSEENPEEVVNPEALSQILYTSGTTGDPKGVMENHRNMLHNAMRLANASHISPEDRITLVRPPSSGGGLCNLLLTLLSGSAIYPVDLKQVGLAALADWLQREKITIFHVGATVFRHFMQQLTGAEKFPDLRMIRVGSGQIFDKDVELFKRYFPDTLLFHILSCTEINTYRVHFLNKDSEVMDGALPVGYALEDMEVLILDDSGNSLGVEEVGEIAVRSAYLFPGYWKNPALTNSAFVGIPDANGWRTFCTGDLGRLQPDGCLEYLGRKDFLLKIRGHRIQAEEIELALLRVPGISQAVVTAYKDAYRDARLIAYVTSVTKEIPSVSQIRDSLTKRLPAQMVPSKFIFLENFPLNSNGKVNRQELPTPEVNRPNLGTRFSAPATAMESMLANIWSEALSINKVGTHDNFFDLGGDSILAMKVIATIGRIFPWNLTLAEFYDACTVAQGAQLLVQKAPNVGQAERIAALCLTMDDLSSTQVETMLANERNTWRPEEEKPISPPLVRVVPREAPILASIAQEPILMLDRMFPDLHQFNIPTAYRLRAPLNLALLKQSLTRLIERHEALRTVFPMEDGKHHQSILKSFSINVEVIDLHELPESERVANATEMSREETQRSFDLARGPLFRVKVFRLSDDDHILIVTIHHVISDSWSMMLLLRDLAELYSATVNGSQSRLPDLPIQYADFAAWQRMVLQEGFLEGQLSYWKRRLSEPLTPMKFSSGVLQNDEMSFFTARKGISISGKLFQAVKTLARQERTTPFVVLLTVLNILLARYLGQEDIRVGTIVANRHQNEVENLIGLFANTVILRTRISEDLNFRKLAQLVREITVSAYSNQDVPFEVLLQTLEKENGIRGDMLSPVLFMFRGEPQPVNLPDLMFSVLDEFQSTTAPEVALTMFDLVLSVKQRSGELTGFFMYKLSVFDEIVVEGFIWNFKNLLERIVCEPTESVSALFSLIEI
jgi:amino acid adenylation domain-containing protein